MENNKNIGCTITLTVKFTSNNNRSYLENVECLLEGLADVVEEQGHNWYGCFARPVTEDEVEE